MQIDYLQMKRKIFSKKNPEMLVALPEEILAD